MSTKGSKVTKIKSNQFKLSDLKPSSYKVNIEVPGNPDVDMWVEIVGTESKEYAVAAAALYKERGGKGDDDISVDQALLETSSLAASLIKDWGPVDVFEMECTEENKQVLMADYDYKWIKQQIEDASAERDNFFTS